MLDLGVLLRVPYVETEMGFDISLDGERAAFSWNPDGRWEIYEISLRSESDPSTGLRHRSYREHRHVGARRQAQPDSSGQRPKLVSRAPGGKFHPRYSPDGHRLAFVADFDGSEHFHIILHDLATGEQTDLTPNVTSSLQAVFAWSPDGKQIAYISDVAGQFDTYVMTIGEGNERIGEDRLVLDAGHPAWKVRWSPDGLWLVVTVEANGADYGTFIVRANGGDVHRIVDENGPINAKDACWSPDSRRLAFCSDIHGNYDIGIYAIETDNITWVTEGNGQKQFPVWSPDGTRLAYVFNLGAVSWLALQELGGQPVLHRVEPGVHYLPKFTPDGNRLIFGFDNPRHPADLWSLSLEEDQFTQLTYSLPEELEDAAFLMPEEIAYPGVDGTPVPALLFRPKVKKPGPAVLLNHGGPDWFFEMTWYPLMVHMVSRGWVVLVPNYRGSTGYGRDWQLASRFDFGGVDTDDVAAGARYLVREGLADPQRIGITGRSHGGYLTASCLTRYPDLWAAGSAVVPFLNWFTNHNEIRPDLQHWDLENFGDPVKDYNLWRERSPSFFLDRIRVPLQLICGRHDARCPISDSIQAYNDLKRMGKGVDLVLYEDEGHTFLKMENVLDSEQRRVAFLAKYLEA